MNKREANRLLNSADDEALQTARELMNQFITTLTGGKWANMEPGGADLLSYSPGLKDRGT